MPDTQPAAATREQLTRRCGHECLEQPDHDEPHFYGYICGRFSYEGLLAENERLRGAIEDHRRVIAAGDPVRAQAEADARLYAALNDRQDR